MHHWNTLKAILVICLLVGLTACTNGQKSEDVNKKIDKLITEGNYNQAFMEISSALKDKTADINTKISLAWLYSYQKDYAKALTVLSEVLEESPNNEEALLLKAEILINIEDVQAAESILTQMIEQFPQNAAVYEKLALVYDNNSDPKDDSKAEEAYKKAIELKPKESLYYLNLSDFYFRKEQYKKAIEQCTKALEYSPEGNKDTVLQTCENIKLRAILSQE